MLVEIKEMVRYRDEYANGGKPITKLENGLLPVSVNAINQIQERRSLSSDDTIFESVEFKADVIQKLKEIAFLIKICYLLLG